MVLTDRKLLRLSTRRTVVEEISYLVANMKEVFSRP